MSDARREEKKCMCIDRELYMYQKGGRRFVDP